MPEFQLLAVLYALRGQGDRGAGTRPPPAIVADLTDYARAHRDVAALYADREAWSRKAVINVASSGKFSSDRTIKQYAEEIWNLKVSAVS